MRVPELTSFHSEFDAGWVFPGVVEDFMMNHAKPRYWIAI
jgi:hypothetical protein